MAKHRTLQPRHDNQPTDEITVTMTRAEAELVYDLLCHRHLKLLVDAAYVAYSSTYNNSPHRREERAAQRAGAEEVRNIVNYFAVPLDRRFISASSDTAPVQDE